MDRLSIGVDLGGTKIAAALVDGQGSIVSKIQIPTETPDGPDAIVKQIADVIEKLKKYTKDQPCESVGIAVAGQVIAEAGVVAFAPNLNWHYYPLKDALTDILSMKVTVLNDVRAATFGEWRSGAGRGIENFVCLFVGTGIGGGIVCNGRLVEGSSNSAGEFGHITVDLHGRQCTCGNRGCLEALAGGWAISQLAQEHIKNHPIEGKPLLDSVGGNIEAIGAKEVCLLAWNNDPLANKIIDGVVEALTAGVVTLVNAFNPSCVIFGGGIIHGLPSLIHQIDARVKSCALKVATTKLTLVQAELKTDAGAIGAALFSLKD